MILHKLHEITTKRRKEIKTGPRKRGEKKD
jgi:hypothetical protein